MSDAPTLAAELVAQLRFSGYDEIADYIEESVVERQNLKAALTAARIEGVREGLERAYAIAKLEEGAGGDFKELLSDLEAIVMADRAAKELPHDHD